MASTTSDVEAHSSHAFGVSTLDKIVGKGKFVDLHRGVLQILDDVERVSGHGSNSMPAWVAISRHRYD